MIDQVPLVGGGFLVAVLWMDLMFDVQMLARSDAARRAALPSIAGYYRRVTTDASPMGHLVGAVMITTLAALAWILGTGAEPVAHTIASLGLAAPAIALGIVRVFPNAVRLGSGDEPEDERLAIADAICRDHLICFGLIVGFVVARLV